MDLITKAFVNAYIEEQKPVSSFLSDMFPFRNRRNILDTKSFEFDIVRSTVKVSTPTEDRTVNMNKKTKFSTKEMTPPNYGEGMILNVDDFDSRRPGENSSQRPLAMGAADAKFAGRVASELIAGFGDMAAKMGRATELQACQIFQECKLDLYNPKGEPFQLEFQRKADLYGNAASSWVGTSDKLTDLANLANKVNRLGKTMPDMAIMGAEAWKEFYTDEAVQKILENRRMELGGLNPAMREKAVYAGNIMAGTYDLQIWVYDDFYEDPETGNLKSYIDPKNVVVLSSKAVRERQSRFLPFMAAPDPRVSRFIPSRVSDVDRNIDFFTNVYLTPNNKSLQGEIESSHLLIPKQVDGHGRLTVIY